MKYVFLFLISLLPYLATSQEATDTIYIERNGAKYFLVTNTQYSDGTSGVTKALLGDSATAAGRLVQDAERQSNTIAIHAKQILLSQRNATRVRLYSNLHNDVTGKSIFVATALRDSAQWVGNWRLVLDGVAYDGAIRLNNNQRLIFDPADGRGYTLTQNILLSTFANHVFFTVSGKRYDLYRINEKRLGCLENDSRLIRIE
jgi:hypothetical protein